MLIPHMENVIPTQMTPKHLKRKKKNLSLGIQYIVAEIGKGCVYIYYINI